MKKRIILVGQATAGKDHIRKLLESNNYEYAISYTTRPPRKGEINGKDYFFLTKEDFQDMIALDHFYEHVVFNNWYYGTTKEQFYGGSDIFIMTPAGLAHLSKEDRNESLVIFLDIAENIRYKRLLERGDIDNVERRINADQIDFKDFKDFDIRISDPDFNKESLSYLSYFIFPKKPKQHQSLSETN